MTKRHDQGTLLKHFIGELTVLEVRAPASGPVVAGAWSSTESAPRRQTQKVAWASPPRKSLPPDVQPQSFVNCSTHRGHSHADTTLNHCTELSGLSNLVYVNVTSQSLGVYY